MSLKNLQKIFLKLKMLRMGDNSYRLNMWNPLAVIFLILAIITFYILYMFDALTKPIQHVTGILL